MGVCEEDLSGWRDEGVLEWDLGVFGEGLHCECCPALEGWMFGGLLMTLEVNAVTFFTYEWAMRKLSATPTSNAGREYAVT